jgi:hypothetical protein
MPAPPKNWLTMNDTLGLFYDYSLAGPQGETIPSYSDALPPPPCRPRAGLLLPDGCTAGRAPSASRHVPHRLPGGTGFILRPALSPSAIGRGRYGCTTARASSCGGRCTGDARGEERGEWEEGEGGEEAHRVTTLVASDDGDYLVAGWGNGQVTVIDGATGAVIRSIVGFGEAVGSLAAYELLGARLVVGGAAGRVAMFALPTGEMLHDSRPMGDEAIRMSACFTSTDGSLLVVAVGCNRAFEGGTLVCRLEGHESDIKPNAVTTFVDGGAGLACVVTGSSDATVRI